MHYKRSDFWLQLEIFMSLDIKKFSWILYQIRYGKRKDNCYKVNSIIMEFADNGDLC